MDEQTQAMFVQWLAQQLGVESEDELKKQMSDMGDEGLQQAFQAFQKEQQTPMNKKGGKLAYLQHLQQGGRVNANNYVSPIQGNVVTDQDLLAYKNSGMDFGSKQAMGTWLDSWGNNPSGQSAPISTTQPKQIRRYNQQTRSWETIPATQVMTESNTMTVGQPGAWGKWDTSAFKKQITPQDTIGQSPAVRQNVQQGWNQQGINPAPVTNYLVNKNAKGGKISDKGQDSKTAVGVTTFTKDKDEHTAINKRMDSGIKHLTALKKLKKAGEKGKTALNRIKDKGKDGASALNRRHDGGMDEHTALNKK